MANREYRAIEEVVNELTDTPDEYAELTSDFIDAVLRNENTDEFIAIEEVVEPRSFYDNFADDLDEEVAKDIAFDLLDKINSDLTSRSDWEESVVTSLKTLGVRGNLNKGSYSEMALFEGASNAEFPMIPKAAVQFVARAIPEILPPSPAKAIPIGKPTLERVDQAKRVAAALNYQLEYLDEGFYTDYQKGLLYLSIAGSIFRKAYHDHITNQNITRYVKPEDFIINYNQNDLESTTRYTHRIFMTANEIRKMQYFGVYSKIDLEGAGELPDTDIIREQVEKEDGFTDSGARDDEDKLHTIYEVHCDLDIEGFEHIGNDGSPTGIAVPYIVTIHAASRQILSLRRNWKPDDLHMRKIVWFVHYKFLPGLGFYGWGYSHVIGSIARACTNLLRAILDGTAFHLLKGGFKSADAKVEGSETLYPGEWRAVESTTEDLAKSFYPFSYEAPSPTVINILQYMDKMGSEMISATEVMVGAANNNGPVGTTLALIEQGNKVYTSIHKSLHKAFGQELRLLSRLNYEYFDDEFFFETTDGEHLVYKEDFNEAVHIMPVSDPNISSFQQRQATDQAMLELAMKLPEYFKMDKLARRVARNLNVEAPEEFMYSEEELREREQMQAEAESQAPTPEQIMQIENQVKVDGDIQKAEAKFMFDSKLLQQDYELKAMLQELTAQSAAQAQQIQILSEAIRGISR